MYGSAQCVMPFCNTFSTRATRKMSAWGLVTENIPWKRERGRRRIFRPRSPCRGARQFKFERQMGGGGAAGSTGNPRGTRIYFCFFRACRDSSHEQPRGDRRDTGPDRAAHMNTCACINGIMRGRVSQCESVGPSDFLVELRAVTRPRFNATTRLLLVSILHVGCRAVCASGEKRKEKKAP